MQTRFNLRILIFLTFTSTIVIINYQTPSVKLKLNHIVNLSQPIIDKSSLKHSQNGSYPNLKYVRSGPAINCLQRPLNHHKYFDLKEMNKSTTNRYAYAWYVSRTNYLCSALVAFKHMKKIRSQQPGNNWNKLCNYLHGVKSPVIKCDRYLILCWLSLILNECCGCSRINYI